MLAVRRTSRVLTKVIVSTHAEWTGQSFIKGGHLFFMIRECLTLRGVIEIPSYIQPHQSEFTPEGSGLRSTPTMVFINVHRLSPWVISGQRVVIGDFEDSNEGSVTMCNVTQWSRIETYHEPTYECNSGKG
jgi:hypothetical protein